MEYSMFTKSVKQKMLLLSWEKSKYFIQNFAIISKT